MPGTPERALPRRHARPRRQAAVRTVPASGAHAEAPERPSVAALRRRELPCDARGKWTAPGGANPPAGAPPVARQWPPERRMSSDMPWLLHACVRHRRDPTSSQPTSRGYKTSPFPLPCAHTHRHRAPPSAIDAASVSSSPRPLPWPPEHV
jgi:hypothetical protein